MGARSIRGKTSASLAVLANCYTVAPGAGIPYVSGPTPSGNAPPIVIMTGQPNAGAGSPVSGIISVTITGGGSLGAATFRLSYNGVSEVTGTTAAVIDLSSGAGIILYFSPGTYDTTQSWVWRTGVATGGGSGTSGGTARMAVGQMPVDVYSNLTMTDSVLARVHTTGGSLLLTLPAAPWDGMRVAVMDADGTAFTSNVLVQSSGGNFLQSPYNGNIQNSSAGSIPLSIPFQCVEWAFDQEAHSGAGLWRVVSDSASGELPVIKVTGTFTLNAKAYVKADSSGGALTINLPPDPTEGMRVKVRDMGGAANTHTITIKSNASGVLIDGGLAFTGGGAASTFALNVQRATAEFTFDSVNEGGGGANGTWLLTGLVTH